MIISLHNRESDGRPSSLLIYDLPKENQGSSSGTSSSSIPISQTASHFLDSLLSKTGIFVIISLFLGMEVGRSTGSFGLAILSFLGGSRHSQEDISLIILVFLGGFCFGYNQTTLITVVLSWLVAFACQFKLRDVIVMTLAYSLGILANASNHVFFVVVFSFLGGKTIQYDQGVIIYVGLTLLVASMGKMKETFPLSRI